MAKSRDAFRTISEVAEWMETPAHVLRFWESKFSQVKPVKRAGGRRYYRPADMELLGGIKKLLHDEGMTIKGVQKVLRDQGIAHVASLSVPVEDEGFIADAPFIDAPEATDTIVPFQPQQTEAQAPEADVPPPSSELSDEAQPAPDVSEPPYAAPDQAGAQPLEMPPESLDTAPASSVPDATSDQQPELSFEPPTQERQAAPEPAPDTGPETSVAPAESFADDPAESPIPSFLRQPLATETETSELEPDAFAPAASQAETPVIPPDPDLATIPVAPGALTALSGISQLAKEDAEALGPIVARLRAVQDRLGPQRRS